MDFKHVRYFTAVAEEGTFTGAAARLNTAQSSVSWGIGRLEAELGATLFWRTTRVVELTPRGRAFLPAARRILAELDAALDSARGEVAGLSPG